MSLRLRVFAGLAVLLALTVAAAWYLTGGAILRPLIGNLVSERVDVALYMAEEIEASDDPLHSARELADKMQVGVELSRAPRHGARRHARVIERKGRTIYVGRGRHTPIMVPLESDLGTATLTVRFPVDLSETERQAGLGLGLLGLVAVLAAVGVSRWVLRPLEVASSAMRRVADGELSHRAPAGSDAAGRMGATFNEMADRVEAMVQGQRQLMAAVSHELRTPLARMRLQSEMLREEGASGERLDGLERNIEAIDELVGELLESSRLDQGAMALRCEQLQASELVAEALGAVDLGERPVTLDVPRDLRVWADRKRLLRALTNLLSNVARYTPDETPVTLRARDEGDHVVIAVADRGPGVPAEALPHLFEPFYRAEASRNRATGGLGLGLMLVRQVVDAHGGTVEARDDGGLVVTMTLPRR